MLQKITDWINKRKQNQLQKVESGDAKTLKKQILKSICFALKDYRFDRSLQIPAITLYIYGSGCDDAIHVIISAPGFMDELRLKLNNSGIYAAANNLCRWSFRKENPQDEKAKAIAEGLFLMLQQKEEIDPNPIPIKARITILHGSMEDDHYILDPAERTLWNIGRGKASIRDGKKHYNYVVIKEIEHSSKIYSINHKVSGKHAYIIHVPNEGYKLKTYTRQEKNQEKIPTTTHLQRTQTSNVFADERQEFLLQDGNQIILNQSVILLFEYITEEVREVEHVEKKTVEGFENNDPFDN